MVSNSLSKTGQAREAISPPRQRRAPPDGYTLLHVTISNAVNATLYEKLNFDLIRDIVPIASIIPHAGRNGSQSLVSSKTVPEFIAYAKANPAKSMWPRPGQGARRTLYAELFKMMTGVDLVQVHYRGSGPALPDLIAGQVHAMFDPIASSIGHIRAGTLRPLAVTTATRSEVLPDIPTVGDFVPGFEASGWYGIAAPRNTPAEIVARLNSEVNAALADPKVKARLADVGTAVLLARPLTSANCSPMTPRSGARWSEPRTSNRSDADPLSACKPSQAASECQKI